jgi:hypothetical protein
MQARDVEDDLNRIIGSVCAPWKAVEPASACAWYCTYDQISLMMVLAAHAAVAVLLWHCSAEETES